MNSDQNCKEKRAVTIDLTCNDLLNITQLSMPQLYLIYSCYKKTIWKLISCLYLKLDQKLQ